MNFKALIKRAEDVDKTFQELQIDLADALKSDLGADGGAPPKSDDIPDSAAGADVSPPEANAANPDSADNTGSPKPRRD